MKRRKIISLTGLLLLLGLSTTVSYADEIGGTGHIQFVGDGEQGIIDPENPSQPVDPEKSSSTEGPLRIDFVPNFNFSDGHAITNQDSEYFADAQLFHGETEARANYVQISNYSHNTDGWTLQLKQEKQFTNTSSQKELKGAVLSLDRSWANTNMPGSISPKLSKEVIRIDQIGETYNLAEAQPGSGFGTWTISFGSSSTAPVEADSTLTPQKDAQGQPLLDAQYKNKQKWKNHAVKLTVPGAAEKEPGEYTTVLTWTLAELP